MSTTASSPNRNGIALSGPECLPQRERRTSASRLMPLKTELSLQPADDPGRRIARQPQDAPKS
jgi:hypothetical protein